MPDASPPAVPASPSTPVLQAASLRALQALDPTGGEAFLRRVLSTYLSSLDRHLDATASARDQADLAQLRAVAHTLKSSSQSIGALSFAQLCAALEQDLRQRLETQATASILDADLAAAVKAFFAMAEQVRAAVRERLEETSPT